MEIEGRDTMEIENLDSILNSIQDRLCAAASLLERAVASLEERGASMNGEVQKIVAAVERNVDRGAETSSREQELERRLMDAERQITELRVQATSSRQEEGKHASARKTLPAATVQLLAKQGIETDQIEPGALDAALTGLSLEQRIAVKSQLLRAGLV
jgi:hypothetical protein